VSDDTDRFLALAIGSVRRIALRIVELPETRRAMAFNVAELNFNEVASAAGEAGRGDEIMPTRFDSGVYRPETAGLMREALEIAWRTIQAPPRDAELVRLLFASAIIDYVDMGVLDAEELASHAIKQLNAAQRLAPGSA
jgi:hypothetical protein